MHVTVFCSVYKGVALSQFYELINSYSSVVDILDHYLYNLNFPFLCSK